jgi:predicted acyl esterase
MGDDWFHNGAFRQQGMAYIYEQQATRKNEAKWMATHFDDYDMFMQAGSAGELGRRHGLEQVGFWRKILEHPSYDAFWRDQAVDKVLAALPLKVPVMLVHSLWDQEDIYGAPAVYKAIEPKDTGNDKVFLVLGPWHHGQEIADGSALGAIRFGSDTAAWFRREVLRPFLDQYLKDGAPKADVAPVTAFETGTNTWRRLQPGPRAARRAAPSARRRCTWPRASSSPSIRPRRATAPTTNTSRTRPSPCPFGPGPSSPSGTASARRGRSGSWTTSAKCPAAPTSSPSPPTC